MIAFPVMSKEFIIGIEEAFAVGTGTFEGALLRRLVVWVEMRSESVEGRKMFGAGDAP